MLRFALLFLILALVFAVLGFGGIAALAFEGAKLIFIVFLVLAVIFLVGGALRGTMPPPP